MLHTENTIAEVAGPSFGLELLLNVRQSDYVPFISESAGVRLGISEAGHFPDLFNHGISLPTGFSVNIGVSTTERRRYNGTNDCDISNLFSSSVECIQFCQAEVLTYQCECNHQSITSGMDGVGETCDFADLECLETELKRVDLQRYCSSQCQVPCIERRYVPLMSMTRWPSGNFEPVVARLANRSKMNYNKISDDILKVKVYLHSLTKEVVEEEVAYTEQNFLSDIGGQLGLWAGFSVLSLSEIVELLCLIIMSCRQRNHINEEHGQDREESRDNESKI
ncbi:degenerin unc-8-like [Pecten maximus]|uniref:degenerin unc-8-like n=1 Tax=Pecten maximus TaxID=6579 RepID=UPI00145865CF|nr:degenerin unc-8-like [Pecten maximus]